MQTTRNMINLKMIGVHNPNYSLRVKPYSEVFRTSNKKTMYALKINRGYHTSLILHAVKVSTGIEFRNDKRQKEIVNARRVYIFLCCALTHATLNEIGSLIQRPHCTVLQSRDKAISLIQANDKELISAVQAACEFLDAKFVIDDV